MDGALEALLADADALARQAAAGIKPAALGLGSLTQVLNTVNSENSLVTRNMCGNGVLLESPK